MIALLAAVSALAADPVAADLVATGVATLDTASSDPQVSSAVRWIVLLTSLSVLPGVALLMTPFTRYIIVFSLLRQALGLQQSPPNQVLIGLSVILTLAVMKPTFDQVNAEAVQPYLAGTIETGVAVDVGMAPMRRYMLENTDRQELKTAIKVARITRPDTLEDLPSAVVVTGFALTELERAFVTGVKIYAPFLVVDLVVASILLGMGMMMVPPAVISLPFKLLLFVLMDGWSLLVLGLTGAGS